MGAISSDLSATASHLGCGKRPAFCERDSGCCSTKGEDQTLIVPHTKPSVGVTELPEVQRLPEENIEESIASYCACTESLRLCAGPCMNEDPSPAKQGYTSFDARLQDSRREEEVALNAQVQNIDRVGMVYSGVAEDSAHQQNLAHGPGFYENSHQQIAQTDQWGETHAFDGLAKPEPTWTEEELQARQYAEEQERAAQQAFQESEQMRLVAERQRLEAQAKAEEEMRQEAEAQLRREAEQKQREDNLRREEEERRLAEEESLRREIAAAVKAKEKPPEKSNLKQPKEQAKAKIFSAARKDPKSTSRENRDSSRSGRSKDLDKEYTIVVEKAEGKSLGVDVATLEDGTLRIDGVRPNNGTNLIAIWNANNPDNPVEPGDIVYECNSVRADGDPSRLIMEIQKTQFLALSLRRPD